MFMCVHACMCVCVYVCVCTYQAINDENFGVREAVMGLVARLANKAALSVMPVVRKSVAQQMEQLQTSDDARMKKEAILLLKCLARGAGSLLGMPPPPDRPSTDTHHSRSLTRT